MVHLLKLVTGEDILAELVEMDTDATWKLENPLQVFLVSTEKGNMALVQPYLQLARDKSHLFLHDNHILYKIEPEPELLEMYNKQTSPLDLPPEKKLVL